ncbi:glycosyltransferase [Pseudoalteromonas sp. DL2-H2.2]|uniref:glycosyltransferase n=1 Tax=Pseudoalteromonas sp. DL2-H2.2 TaxID=2908889 RepID=UPI001F2C8E86|nr:glycosyltransferase [Pseudoalteromonas sp. DL2-H2.2]MCF2908832.1 glycosyltransferase [Pseudoalteromonas sp. DL2-H2.2]
MNILIVQNSAKTTWSFREYPIRRLIDNGHSVSVVCIHDCQESIDKLVKIGVNVVSLQPQNHFKKALGLTKLVRRVVSEHDIDVIMCHFVTTFLLAYPALWLFRKKTILFIEGLGTLLYRSKAFAKVVRLLAKPGFRRVFMNNDEYRILGSGEDLVLGGIGLDLNKYTLQKKHKKALFSMVFAGRLISDKGIYEAVEILRGLLARHVDVQLDIFGDIYPANPTSLSKEQLDILKREFGDRIQFHGYVSDLQDELVKADLLLLPSRHEGFPVVVMEASASGTPSLVFDVPGCRDAVQNGINGIVVPLGDVALATKKVADLIDLSDKEYQAFSERCVVYARVNYDANDKFNAVSRIL